MSTTNTPALPNDDEYFIKEFGWTKSQFDVIRRMYLNEISNDEIKVFCYVCKQTGLNPMLKQIYAIPRKGKMTIQTAIDGYRLVAERTGRYSPGRDSTFTYDKDGNIVSATAYIKKMTPDGTWHEVSATAFTREYNPGVGPFWQKMPHTMISKCAEALALRKAFPAELSGVYTKEEMDQADRQEQLPIAESEDVTPSFQETIPITQSEPPQVPKMTPEQVKILNEKKVAVEKIALDNMIQWATEQYGTNNFADMPEFAFAIFDRGMDRNIESKNKAVE